MAISKKDREAVYNKLNGKCAYCGCELHGKWQLDHIIPQWHLNANPPYATPEQVHCLDNYLPACFSCNNYKSGNPLESFRKALQKQPEGKTHEEARLFLREFIHNTKQLGWLPFDNYDEVAELMNAYASPPQSK